MTENLGLEWSAVCNLQYPPEVELAWLGLAKTLLNGFKGRGPVVEPPPPENKNSLRVIFDVSGISEEDALQNSRSELIAVLGDERPIQSIRVVLNEELDNELYGLPGDLREQRRKRDRKDIWKNPRILTLGPPTIERQTDAIIHEFTPEPKDD